MGSKLALAEARRHLASIGPSSTLHDLEQLLGAATRTIVAEVRTYVFELLGGEIRVGSRDGSKLKFVRVYERPAGVPANAVLSDGADEYELGQRDREGRRVETWTAYAVTTGALVRRTVYEDGEASTIDEAGPDGRLVPSLHPLLVAIHDQQRAKVKQLLATASPQRTTEHGSTLLHHLAEHLRDAAFAQDLIARGADVDARDAEGRTPLYVAIQHGRARNDFIETLLRAGADVNARCRTHFDNTVLHLACETKSGVMTDKEAQLALWLLDQGADPAIPDAEGRSPRDVAAQYARPAVIAALGAKKPSSAAKAKPKPAAKPKPRRS